LENVAAKRGQADEPEVPVKVREWITLPGTLWQRPPQR
jgi:hypothetical protein